MNLRLLVFLFPLLIFSQSKKDQISILERKLSILKVENFELQEELDNCSDSQISLSYEKKNLQLELKSKIDSINSIKINLQNKIDSIIDLYEEEEYRFNMLNKEFYNIEGQIEIKDSLIENLELENNELKNKLNNKSDIKDDVLSDFFLTNLYQGDDKINNQTFSLRFEGVLNYEIGNVKVLDNYGDLDTENMFNFSRLILVKELFLKVHSPINKKSSWKESCNCPSNPTIYKKNNYLDGVLPNLSFIKGKLVTISNDYQKQNFSTDFLFSEGEFEKEDREYEGKGSYLYDFKYFSFTKEGESLSETRSIVIPLVVIHGRVFLLLNNSLISNLDLGFKFFNDFSGCDGGDGSWASLAEGGEFLEYKKKNDNNAVWRTCSSNALCKEKMSDDYYETRCNRPILIEVFKKPDAFSSEEKMYIDNKDYFLFELVEQE